MEEQVLALVQKLKKTDVDGDVLELLCRCACQRLDGLLAEGVEPQGCGERYLLAAAWLAVDWLEQVEGGADITSLTAGDLSVQRRQQEDARLYRRALELMAPYLKDEGFVFRGVSG